MKQRRNISLAYHNGVVVSVILSKDEKKVRIQSNDISHLWLIFKEFMAGLKVNFRSHDMHDVIDMEQDLPLKELFTILDNHFNLRDQQNKLIKMLEKRTI